MENERSPEHYWNLAKTWFEEHQGSLAWPFEQVAAFFHYLIYIVQDGSQEERCLMVGGMIVLLLIAYMIFMLGLREVILRLPGFNRVPLGLPQSKDYLVQPTGYDRPIEYEWRYPVLWIGGTEFNFEKAMLDKKDPLRFYLKTGTDVQFLSKHPGRDRK